MAYAYLAAELQCNVAVAAFVIQMYVQSESYKRASIEQIISAGKHNYIARPLGNNRGHQGHASHQLRQVVRAFVNLVPFSKSRGRLVAV